MRSLNNMKGRKNTVEDVRKNGNEPLCEGL